MRKSECRIKADLDRIQSESFIELCRNGNASAFTRQRKMPLYDLALSMINWKGLSLTLELRNFMNISHPGEHISKPGYLKQRMKLNPKAFADLYQFHNKNFYADPDTRLYTVNGFLALAADGSSAIIPTTAETVEKYGNATTRDGKPCAQLGLACLYDVLNHLTLDMSINKNKFNEMEAAEAQIDNVKNTIGDHPFFVIMDWGYPSTPSFLRMIDKGIYFVIRLKSSDYKEEQNALSSDDEDAEIELTNSRRRHYRNTPDEELMMSRDRFMLRFVRVWLDNEHTDYEILATNLPRDTFPKESFKDIYHIRWNLETSFEFLKDRLEIENFTGTKPIIIEQDIYSTIYVYNIAEDIAHDIECEQEEHFENDYKHRMKINRSICIGMLKNDLIYIILEKDPQRKALLFQNLYDDISNNIVPVRPDRHYKRSKGNTAGKYSNTHKRCY